MTKAQLAAVGDAPPATQPGRKPRQPQMQIDLTQPVFVLMWQTTAGQRFEHFSGIFDAPDLGREAAIRSAQTKAVEIKTRVIVLGPQIGAFEPPPVDVAIETKLAFG